MIFRFEDPLFLGALLLLPLLSWVRRRWASQRSGALRFSALERARETGEGASRWRHRVPGFLRGLALAALVVALARPQTGVTSESFMTQGIDIVLAMDVSSSMLAEDLRPNRLEAAKQVAAEFVQGRRNDRIGLVAFAGEAYTQAPLTLDHGVIVGLLDELSVGMIDDGTAVGMGLATAVKRLEASDAESKVVVLLTDGRNNRGEIGPATAAQLAEALGVRVYTIGAGSRGTARVPVDDPRLGRRYVNIRVDIDEASLREVAEKTGGRYFRATDRESLQTVYEEIDALETTEMEVEHYTRYGERFPLVLAAGFLLLVTEIGLAQTALRKLP
jgi:Ca-activated chloride channel family protein